MQFVNGDLNMDNCSRSSQCIIKDTKTKKALQTFDCFVPCADCEICQCLVDRLNKALIGDAKEVLLCYSSAVSSNLAKWDAVNTCYIVVDRHIDAVDLVSNGFIEGKDWWYKATTTVFKYYGKDPAEERIDRDPVLYCMKNEINYRVVNDFRHYFD